MATKNQIAWKEKEVKKGQPPRLVLKEIFKGENSRFYVIPFRWWCALSFSII